MLNPEDAKQAVRAYRECAGNAVATLEAMLGRLDELNAPGVTDVAQEVRDRTAKLIAQADSLCSMVQSTSDLYGSSGTDIAQIFKAAVSSAGQGPSARPARGVTVQMPLAGNDFKDFKDFKDRFADFVSHMGQADQVCKPLKQSWQSRGESGMLAADEYQRSWVQLVNGAVELSQTIDKLSRAIANDG